MAALAVTITAAVTATITAWVLKMVEGKNETQVSRPRDNKVRAILQLCKALSVSSHTGEHADIRSAKLHKKRFKQLTYAAMFPGYVLQES